MFARIRASNINALYREISNRRYGQDASLRQRCSRIGALRWRKFLNAGKFYNVDVLIMEDMGKVTGLIVSTGATVAILRVSATRRSRREMSC